MKYINGWYWPDTDIKSHASVYNKMLKDLNYVLDFVPEKKTCVQAGGAVGIWPQYLSGFFEEVYTFEPDPIQFECLESNITAKNVYKYKCALGKKSGFVKPVHDYERCNASYVINEQGNTKCITLDSLNIEKKVDFICLDMEGYEFFALQGAENMLQEHSPVVQVENKHYNRYNVNKTDIKDFMESIGYSLAYTHKRDEVYIRR